MIPLFLVSKSSDPVPEQNRYDTNNSGKFVKICGVVDDDEEDKETALAKGQVVVPPAQDPPAPSLAQVMEVLGQLQLNIGHLHERFDSMDQRLDTWLSISPLWIVSLIWVPILMSLKSTPHPINHPRLHRSITTSFINIHCIISF